MLLRDRQFRIKVNQLIDGCLFALGLWLAWLIRFYWPQFGQRGGRGSWRQVANLIFRHREVDAIAPFADYLWLFLVVIPMAPLVLEWQGFYERSIFSSVKQMAWQLARACVISVVGLMVIDVHVEKGGGAGGLCALWLLQLRVDVLQGGIGARGLTRPSWARRNSSGALSWPARPRTPAVCGPRLAQRDGGIGGRGGVRPERQVHRGFGALPCTNIRSTRSSSPRATLFSTGWKRPSGPANWKGSKPGCWPTFSKPRFRKPAWTIFTGGRCWSFIAGRRSPGRVLVKQIMDLVGRPGRCWWSCSPIMLAAAVAIKLTSPGRCSSGRSGRA